MNASARMDHASTRPYETYPRSTSLSIGGEEGLTIDQHDAIQCGKDAHVFNLARRSVLAEGILEACLVGLVY